MQLTLRFESSYLKSNKLNVLDSIQILDIYPHVGGLFSTERK